MKNNTELLASSLETERILFALSPRERKIFLPDFEPEDFSTCTVAITDHEEITNGSWENMLREFRPTILVSAWSTKPLPVYWVESEDFSLRYLCHITGSLSGVMSRRLYELGVRATNWGALTTHAVAEHALLLVLGLLRGLPRWNQAISEQRWTLDITEKLQTRSLHGRIVGLHGFGAIARKIIELLVPFNPTEVRVFSHGVPEDFIRKYGARPCTNPEELFSGCEVLIECESLTNKNQGLVDAHLLSLLSNDAVFVNVGRAAVVDEDALLREVESGRLRIGTDVYHHEPVSPDYPLFKAPGVLTSPHIAGPTYDIYRQCGKQAMSNLRRYLSGQSLVGEVSLTDFERMT